MPPSLTTRDPSPCHGQSQLFLSVNTVRSHLERIRDKAGACRRAELVRYALQAAIDPVALPAED